MSSEPNKHGLTRYLSEPIARKIRQECGFGCVICGFAICDYEHIEPEFKDAEEHDPSKMALLCGGCHRKVTSGYFSKEKVKEARANPVCLKQGFCSEWFDFGPENPSIVVGGASFYKPDCVLKILDQTLLEVKGPEVAGGPIRVSGLFYNKDGKLIFSIEDNLWKGQTENWDIETVGQTTTIRRESRNIALVIRTDPRKTLTIERLDMFYKGVRICANEKGVCFGLADKELFGFAGQIINPECCLKVFKDVGQQIPSAVQIGSSINFSNNTICGGGQCALSIRGHGLILGVGYNAIKVQGSLVRIPRDQKI
ncbi:MAG: hypothetical protein JWM68_2063 [Verrucomicrobiales bacterium]|nr:hypothetical protein [Verrucomicrobiales bacterium]